MVITRSVIEVMHLFSMLKEAIASFDPHQRFDISPAYQLNMALIYQNKEEGEYYLEVRILVIQALWVVSFTGWWQGVCVTFQNYGYICVSHEPYSKCFLCSFSIINSLVHQVGLEQNYFFSLSLLSEQSFLHVTLGE